MRLFITLFLATAMAHAEVPLNATIAIQPLGAVKQERLDVVKKSLQDAFGLKVEILAAKALPAAAWHAPRSRYRAEKLLDFLKAGTPATYQIVVGVASKDISTTKEQYEDWGIFGLGELAGRACVVSTFRLGARGVDEKTLRERLGKVAIHEAGHVMGLDHCLKQGCVMQDAESSIATVDAETGGFCESCKAERMIWLKETAAR